MAMRSRAAAALVMALGATLVRVGAASADPQRVAPIRVVSIEECAALALSHDAGLRSDELESAAANARLTEMKDQYIPSVSIQAGCSRLSDVSPGSISVNTGFGPPVTATFPASPLNSTVMRLSLQQPVFTGLRISSSIRQADAARTAAASDVQRTRAEVGLAARSAFWQLARAKCLEAAAREGQAQLERKLAETTTFFSEGVATNNDVLQAGSLLEDARMEVVRAASARELARVQLAQLIGLSLTDPLDVAEVASAVPEAVDLSGPALEGLVTRALAARPELAGARSRVEAQEAAADAVRAGRLPSIVLTGDYTLANPNPRVQPPQDEFTGTWSVGVMASFDVGRYPQASAQEEQARDRAAEAREMLGRQSEAVAAEVVRAAISLGAAVSGWESLAAQSRQADDNARYMDERFRQGLVLQTAQLDAQSLLRRARLRQQAGLIDCLAARAALDHALGD